MTTESEPERDRRRHRRALFDAVADRYDACRPSYPAALVDTVMSTASLGQGASVLEVGCGTGQLTEELVARGLTVTAIDIGPSMVSAARRRVPAGAVQFRVASFEEFPAADDTYDLVAFADAFHWIDPDVRYDKSARVLRRAGWLVVTSIRQDYDEPLGATLRGMWVERSEGGDAWADASALVEEEITASGLFSVPSRSEHGRREWMPAEYVLRLESTRATALSWNEAGRTSFLEELETHLAHVTGLTEVTSVTMAQLASG